MYFHQTVALFGLLISLLLARPAQAATFYVSPTGSDSAAGSLATPFLTVGRAQTAASGGDTVFIRGGVYAFTGSGTGGLVLNKSGQSGALISYFAYQAEVPVFDLSNLTPTGRVTGIDLTGSYVHLRGLEVKGVPQYAAGQDSWGVRIRGSNNVVERLNVHHNDAPGIFISGGANNLILNCDSHHNYDFLEDGGSGDGFGCHSTGDNNVMRGCRGFDNSDDGYDFINAAGTCLVEKSWAFRNGYVPDTNTAAGNGAGFKAGGYGSPPVVPSGGAAEHTVRQCLAFGNRSQGFYANHHPGRIQFLNNTAFRNSTNYNMLADSGYPSDHILKNNIAMATGTVISNLNGGAATYNSWNLGLTVNASDFVNVAESEATAARATDGSLPNIGLMHLVAASDLIDKGTDVGLEFLQNAPDLGAFEFGEDSGGTGGSSGSGGADGSGGDPGTGGTDGAGGTAATGGADGSGGDSGTGGTDGAGGTAATGGADGAGGSGVIGGSGGGPGSSCTVPLARCGDACVDTSSDVLHCGTCGVGCDVGEVCSFGACSASGCDTSLTQCASSCVDLTSHLLHCGACGASCLSGQGCTNGLCTGAATGGDPTQPETVDDDAEGDAAGDVAQGPGCSCRVVGRSPPSTVSLLLIALLVAAHMHRRRRGA